MKEKENKLGFETEVMRQPGQSVDEELNDFYDETVINHLGLITLSIALATFAWIAWLMKTPPNPVAITIGCLPVIIYSLVKLKNAKSKIYKLKKGRDGERYVGHLLEELRAHGYKVFHDIVGDAFNIDHVIIGPSGIYVIETKTWSKVGNDNDINYDGQRMFVNGKALEKNPIHQVQAEARTLSNLLNKTTGKRFSVKAVLALPSWFVKPEFSQLMLKESVLVVNPKNILAILKNQKESLSDEDIHLTSHHLSLHIKHTSST